MALTVLRLGSTGPDVSLWQSFLLTNGYYTGEVDGKFGPATHKATCAYQAHNRTATSTLTADGIVGAQTYAVAIGAGFGVVHDDNPGTDTTEARYKCGPGWPTAPSVIPRLPSSTWGAFKYHSAPQPTNQEAIEIEGTWVQDNIVNVHIPQLSGKVHAPASCSVQFHAKAAKQLAALWAAWEAAHLLPHIWTWDGSWVPRYIRGSRSILSNHAYGTAFDINAAYNGLGKTPALIDQPGCVRELVGIAWDYGFAWGGWYPTRPDGMHFEVARLIDP